MNEGMRFLEESVDYKTSNRCYKMFPQGTNHLETFSTPTFQTSESSLI